MFVKSWKKKKIRNSSRWREREAAACFNSSISFLSSSPGGPSRAERGGSALSLSLALRSSTRCQTLRSEGDVFTQSVKGHWKVFCLWLAPPEREGTWAETIHWREKKKREREKCFIQIVSSRKQPLSRCSSVTCYKAAVLQTGRDTWCVQGRTEHYWSIWALQHRHEDTNMCVCEPVAGQDSPTCSETFAPFTLHGPAMCDMKTFGLQTTSSCFPLSRLTYLDDCCRLGFLEQWINNLRSETAARAARWQPIRARTAPRVHEWPVSLRLTSPWRLSRPPPGGEAFLDV